MGYSYKLPSFYLVFNMGKGDAEHRHHTPCLVVEKGTKVEKRGRIAYF